MSGFLTWIQSAIYNLVVPLLPNSLQELLLFIVTVVLVIVIIDLFVYTNIQRRIKNDSRCYQENKNNLSSAGYTTFVKTANGNNMIGSITYKDGKTVWQDLCGPKLERDSTGSYIGTPTTVTYYMYDESNPGKALPTNRSITCPRTYITTEKIFTGNNPQFNRFTQVGGSTDFFKNI